tara:strand:- start:411 stop:635 length:225 start_codon:yes stop_codon:yes gene_type:complete
MKRLLLLPLVLGFTSPVNAESYWLILTYSPDATGMVSVEMKSLDDCKIQGEQWVNSTTHGKPNRTRKFHCVVGK